MAKSVMWNSQRRHPRRADGGARRGPDTPGARPRAASGRAGPRRGRSSRTTSTTSSRSPTGSPSSGSASAWRSRAGETTQQEVVHAITAGKLDHVPGMDDARSGRGRRPSRTRRSTRELRAPTAGARRARPGQRPPIDERHESETLSGYMRRWWQGVRAGELGTLPIIVGLVLIVIDVRDPRRHLLHRAELHQPAPADGAVATIAIGVVFVLLIGEIDLVRRRSSAPSEPSS